MFNIWDNIGKTLLFTVLSCIIDAIEHFRALPTTDFFNNIIAFLNHHRIK